MIYTYRKYKGINEFINNISSSKKDEEFTILHKCNGYDLKKEKYKDDCFGCLFCINNSKQLDNFLEYRGKDFIKKIANTAFRGELVPQPSIIKGIRHKYRSLEQFTETDETTNIQPWAAALLSNISQGDNRIGMEIPVFNTAYDRNGRLDIGIISEGQFLVLETKNCLNDALNDERFVEQQEKYTSEIQKYTNNYLYLTFLGGCETDLLPFDNKYCTSNIGDGSKRFYNLLLQNRIRFMSANALLCLVCKYIEFGQNYSWNNFLFKTFNTLNSCLGLLSAGAVTYENNKFIIKPLLM